MTGSERDADSDLLAHEPGMTLAEDRGGKIIRIDTPRASAEVALQGAQVLSWRPAHTGTDVLWCSPLSARGGGKAIRGGIPICWPWFGPHPVDPARGQHGVARNLDWMLAHASGGPTAVLAFGLGPIVSGALDLSTSLVMRIGASLELDLTTKNVGREPQPLSTAFHPYFEVSDVRTIAVGGLDGAGYLDLAAGGAAHVQPGLIRFDGALTRRFDDAPAVQFIDDPGHGRRIAINRREGRSAIVWHPGAGAAAMADIPALRAHQFVCVESGDVGDATVLLAPGAFHRLRVVYSVEPLR
jgi:D-hexose-6-phosphate mutarotase